jgi:hypothetical protein
VNEFNRTSNPSGTNDKTVGEKMKIKLSWNYDSDEWDVHDEQDDWLTHSSRYDGEYVSVDEVERLKRAGEDLLSKYNAVTSVKQFEGLFPVKVCLCGSTRFQKAYNEAERNETLKGNLVLSISCNMKTDPFFSKKSSEELEGIKTLLDEIHLRKIDMSDEIFVLNVGGYIGESTAREIKYAREHGKRVRFLEEGFIYD